MIQGATIRRARTYRKTAEATTIPASQSHAGPGTASRLATARLRTDAPAHPVAIRDELVALAADPRLQLAGLQHDEREQVSLARERAGDRRDDRLRRSDRRRGEPVAAHLEQRLGQLELAEVAEAVGRV